MAKKTKKRPKKEKAPVVEDEELVVEEAVEEEESEDETSEDAPAMILEPVLIRHDMVEENAWNPFKETDDVFNLLVEEIEKEGFDEPITVVPIRDEGTDNGKSEIVRSTDEDTSGWLVEIGSQKYRIVNGAHRWRAARVLEFEYIPAVIKENWDERTQKVQTVRRNMIHGVVDPRKMSNLIEDIRKRHRIGPEAAARKMGIFNEKEFKRYYLKKRQEQKKANEKRRQDQKAVQAVENMQTTLTQIFQKSGGTISQGYVSFMWKGEDHLMVGMDSALKRTIKGMIEFLDISGTNACQFIHEALEAKMMATAVGSDVARAAVPEAEEAEESEEDTDEVVSETEDDEG